MMKTDWSLVPSEEINKPNTEIIGGVSFEVMAAYFDIPEAARFIFDEVTNEFVIDFKYLTAPESLQLQKQKAISLQVGKNTKRIYQIRIDASEFKFNDDKRITFNIIVSAENVFKENKNKFSDLNKINSSVVESFLDWGIQNRKLNLHMAAG